MKKITLFFYLVLLPHVFFAQSIDQNDIDIFINGFIQFSVAERSIFRAGFEAYQYEENRFRAIAKLRGLAFSDNAIDRALINNTQHYLNEALNRTVPPRYEALYVEMGWENDGPRIFSTIETIHRSLTMERWYGVDVTRILELQTVFDPKDLELVRNNFERIEEMFDEYLGLFGR